MLQEMVFDKSPDGSVRPRYLIYDVMQIEVSDFISVSQSKIWMFSLAEKPRGSIV